MSAPKKTTQFCSTIRDTGRGLARKSNFASRRPEDVPKTYEEIKSQCLASGTLWEDPDFPAISSSIYFKNPPPMWPDVQWKRPGEICSNPQLFVDGANRMDINQGILSDCWLLAALASLTTNQALLHNVVPPDQSFNEEYHGVFRFQFWQYGRWVEVLIDDLLPTYDNKLIYLHSTDRNEFWSALLEKAYAKLNGSYEALSFGMTSEALTDFTGGMIDRYKLKDNAPPRLFEIMLKAQKKGCLMGCSIDVAEKVMEAKLDNGLIIGHAYSITDVRTIQTSEVSEITQMVRVRNPWGDSNEWKGAWGDGSEEWNTISCDQKRDMGLTFEHDGEFWISFNDFVSNFDSLEICFLGPESMGEIEVQEGIRKWKSCLFEGGWQRGVNAGGCRNYTSTFWANPQYHVKIANPDSDDEDGNGSIIIGLMQKQRRLLKKEGGGNLNIGYNVYKADEPPTCGVDKNFFERPVVAHPRGYSDLREVSGHHKLPPGDYVLVPTTFVPNEEGDFILRIFNEGENDQAGELDHATATVDTKVDALGEQDPKDEENLEMGREKFLTLAGADGVIDVFELKDILNSTFKTDSSFDGFTKDAARNMVTMRDIDKTGRFGFEEFNGLWGDLILCKRTFKMMDADGNGYFDSYEFRNALNIIGLSVNNATFKTIVIRYSDKDGHVMFDDFVSCYLDLKNLLEIIKASKSGGDRPAISELSPKVDALGEQGSKYEENMEMGREKYLTLAGADGEIDVFELQDILNSTFKTDSFFDGFTKEAARNMVTMLDIDKTGRLGFEEFNVLWADLTLCKRTFKLMDADGNGYFNNCEFRNALNIIGLSVDDASFKTIVIRYSDKQGHVKFEDFVGCYLDLKNLLEVFKAPEWDAEGPAAALESETEDQNQESPEVVKKDEVTGAAVIVNSRPTYNNCTICTIL